MASSKVACLQLKKKEEIVSVFNLCIFSFTFLQNHDLARFPQRMIASDQRLTAVFEMEPKEEIFRSFHFHHKSVGKISGEKKLVCTAWKLNMHVTEAY